MEQASNLRGRMRYAKSPFPDSVGGTFLGIGSLGMVHGITANVAFKSPNLWNYGYSEGTGVELPLAPGDEVAMAVNIGYIESEKKIYDMLNSHPHPNLLSSILHVPEGIFMPRMESTLHEQLALPTVASPERQERWIYQLVSAAAWLEKLGYIHGDLRPQNILLDKSGDIKVADFDCAATIGTRSLAGTTPFYRWSEESTKAGPEMEQFALGSCIYNILFRVLPFGDAGLDSPLFEAMSVKGDFPPVPNDRFGSIIEDCWKGTYPSIAALHTDIATLTKIQPAPWKPSCLHRWYLLAECHGWLSWQRRLQSGSVMERLILRCHSVCWNTLRVALGSFHGGY